MNYTINFYKEGGNKWYVNLPQWIGSKEELEMVCGADVLLDIISNYSDNVTINVSLEKQGDFELTKYDEDESGAYYNVWDNKIDEKLDFTVWLCNVSTFVFGYHPEKIWFTKNK